MTVAVGSIIYGSDYNVIQTSVNTVLGSTYGQATQSGQVAVGQLITAAQWQNLANDVNTIYTHQNGSSFSGYSSSMATTGSPITAAMYTALYNLMASLAGTTTTVASNQLTTVTVGTNTYGSTWPASASANGGIQNSGSITFASPTALQYFWNTGGSIQFQGTGPGSTSTTQNADWATALSGFNYTLNYSNVWGSSNTVIQTLSNLPSYYSNSYIQLSGYISGATIYWTIHYENAVPTNWNSTWSPSSANQVAAGAGYITYLSYASGALSTVYTDSSSSMTASWSTTS